MAGRTRKKITLKDPRTMRALSHPARVAVIDELYSGRVATSTELAALTEETHELIRQLSTTTELFLRRSERRKERLLERVRQPRPRINPYAER